MKKYAVRFSYFVEIEVDETKCPEILTKGKELWAKHQAITNAILEFEKEFQGESLRDIALTLAPISMSDVREIF